MAILDALMDAVLVDVCVLLGAEGDAALEVAAGAGARVLGSRGPARPAGGWRGGGGRPWGCLFGCFFACTTDWLLAV